MSGTVRKFLQSDELFSSAEEATRARLIERASVRRLTPNELLFSEGDPANAVFGVLKGRISICLHTVGGRQLRLNEVGPGGLLGEIAVMDGGLRSASAIALTAGEAVVLRRDDVLTALESDPALARRALIRLCAELRRVSGHLADAGLLDTNARLARRLLDRADETGGASEGEAVARITQEELAQSFGVSRVTVNKHLNEWRRRRWVSLSRNKITILSIDALVALIEERSDQLGAILP